MAPNKKLMIRAVLDDEPNSTVCESYLQNPIALRLLITIVVIPLFMWILFCVVLRIVIPEFLAGAYSALVIGYIGYHLEQMHALRIKWHRALVDLELIYHALWNDIECERFKLSKAQQVTPPTYEYPPDLNLASDVIKSLGRLGIKNAAFHIECKAKELSGNLRILANMCSQQSLGSAGHAMITQAITACDQKAKWLQESIVETLKSIIFFTKNDKPLVVIPFRYSRSQWAETMDKDPKGITKTFISNFP